MTKDEALKLALEALEMFCEHGAILRPIETRDAIKEALAQPEQTTQQEPEYVWPTVADYERDVGFETNQAFRMAWNMARTTNKMLGHTSAPQREWVGLTDEQIETIWRRVQANDFHDCVQPFARAIEAARGIKE